MGIMFDIFCIGDNESDTGARGYGRIKKARRMMYGCFLGSVVMAGVMVSGGDALVWELVVGTLRDVLMGMIQAWIV